MKRWTEGGREVGWFNSACLGCLHISHSQKGPAYVIKALQFGSWELSSWNVLPVFCMLQVLLHATAVYIKLVQKKHDEHLLFLRGSGVSVTEISHIAIICLNNTPLFKTLNSQAQASFPSRQHCACIATHQIKHVL